MDGFIEKNVFEPALNKNSLVAYINDEIPIKNLTTKQTKGGDERR